MRLTYLIGQLDRIVSRRLTEMLAAHGLSVDQVEISMLGNMSDEEQTLRTLLHGCVKNLREG